jgi:tRNA dimethylallyltransferase
VKELIGVVGPTASGKSRLALALAEELGGEIISIDSMQVYRGMDIGTAKATADERARVPHHMLDLVEPAHDFSVAEFQVKARAAMDDCERRGVTTILVGGSGMHLRSVIDPMAFAPTDATIRAELERLDAKTLAARLLEVDPGAAELVDLANPRRTIRALEAFRIDGRTPSSVARSPDTLDVKSYTPIRPVKLVGLDSEDGVSGRVADRLGKMFSLGLLDEVQALVGSLGRTAMQAVGYKELFPVIDGRTKLKEGADAIYRSTLALVKRQRTYFRRDPRITWIGCDQPFDQMYREAKKAL